MLRWRDSTALDWREETLSQESYLVPVLMDAEVSPPDQSEVSVILYQPMRCEYYLVLSHRESETKLELVRQQFIRSGHIVSNTSLPPAKALQFSNT